jgi:hypothetical protein
VIKFLDGPAVKAKGLLLQSAPIFLRVVMTPSGEFDALDQPNDQPNPTEAVYAYRRTSYEGTVHLRFGGRGRRSGTYQSANYAFIAEQPADAVLRDSMAWKEWALAEHAKTREG